MDFHQDYSSHRQYKLSMILNVMDELFAVNLKLYRDTTMCDRRHLFFSYENSIGLHHDFRFGPTGSQVGTILKLL